MNYTAHNVTYTNGSGSLGKKRYGRNPSPRGTSDIVNRGEGTGNREKVR
jgi:hypothetical protein